MARSARVMSIDALQTMGAALGRFGADASAALDDLEMEVRRAVQWIHHDCKEYWTQEVRRGWERVAEARVQLQQAMMFRSIDDHRPSCVDEKKALQQAQRRLQIAQNAVEAIRHWEIAIDRAVDEYRGSRSVVVNWLDADLPQAVAALSRMTASLESYVALEAPAEEFRPPAAAPTAQETTADTAGPAAGGTAQVPVEPVEEETRP